jgi:anti-sigma regulatory factor (Ser/Thr protein kinase)
MSPLRSDPAAPKETPPTWHVPTRLSLELDPVPAAGGEARDAVRAHFGSILSESALQNLLLVVSELVANSVAHGPGRPIGVRVTLRPNGRIRGVVEDHGRGEVVVPSLAEAGAVGGYGLRIVSRLTEGWGFTAGTTNVWFEMRAQSRRGSVPS